MKNPSLLITISSALLLGLLAMTIRPSVASPEAAQEKPTSNAVEPSAMTDVSPLVFNYQGQLTNASGNPITNASLPMTFRLYTVLTGGTACWTESQTVNVANGQFNVLLGQTTAIPASCVTNSAYLELVVNGETLTPREMLTSVASAVQANTLVADARTQGAITIPGIATVGEIKSLPGNANLGISNTGNHALRLGSANSVYLFIDSDDNSADSAYFNIYRNSDHLGGNVTPILNLNENGNMAVGGTISSGSDLLVSGSDIAMAYTPRGDGGRALVHDWNDTLTLNYSGDFSGGTRIQSTLSVWGQTTIAGDLNVDRVINAAGLNVGSCKINTRSEDTTPGQTDCEGGTITSGAYVEANLMTNEERISEAIDRFEKGDLLCWSAEGNRLEKCSSANDPLVMGVADANGKPIVLGAEQIKVLGPVQVGDYLVASDVPGYATASDDPSFGIVIGQALENLEGEQGLIKAMIRKM